MDITRGIVITVIPTVGNVSDDPIFSDVLFIQKDQELFFIAKVLLIFRVVWVLKNKGY